MTPLSKPRQQAKKAPGSKKRARLNNSNSKPEDGEVEVEKDAARINPDSDDIKNAGMETPDGGGGVDPAGDGGSYRRSGRVARNQDKVEQRKREQEKIEQAQLTNRYLHRCLIFSFYFMVLNTKSIY